jgi:hypothetical protein
LTIPGFVGKLLPKLIHKIDPRTTPGSETTTHLDDEGSDMEYYDDGDYEYDEANDVERDHEPLVLAGKDVPAGKGEMDFLKLRPTFQRPEEAGQHGEPREDGESFERGHVAGTSVPTTEAGRGEISGRGTTQNGIAADEKEAAGLPGTTLSMDFGETTVTKFPATSHSIESEKDFSGTTRSAMFDSDFFGTKVPEKDVSGTTRSAMFDSEFFDTRVPETSQSVYQTDFEPDSWGTKLPKTTHSTQFDTTYSNTVSPTTPDLGQISGTEFHDPTFSSEFDSANEIDFKEIDTAETSTHILRPSSITFEDSDGEDDDGVKTEAVGGRINYGYDVDENYERFVLFIFAGNVFPFHFFSLGADVVIICLGPFFCVNVFGRAILFFFIINGCMYFK